MDNRIGNTLRSIVRSFIAVYPNAAAMIASNSLETPVLGLVARRDSGRFDIAALRPHLAHSSQAPALGIDDEFALLGGFVAGARALQQFAASAPLNTDDHPVVAHSAPRITYAPDSLPRDRLIELLHELSIAPSELLAARDLFIESGRSVQPTMDASSMLMQVRSALLAVLRISPDFRPACDPLVLMATSLAQTDAPAAKALLVELTRTQPARSEAAMALQLIEGK